jgi:L,D-peptidoglycan transpeptidase YkuD (ErfK/YbiS/YcfS/YnhG family)
MQSRRHWTRWLAATASGLTIVALTAACAATSTRGQDTGAAAVPAVGPRLAQQSAAPTQPTSPAPTATKHHATPTTTPSPSPSAIKRVKPTPTPAPSAKKTTTPSNLASSLRTLPASTDQVIIVHSMSASTTYASLETYVKTSTGWQPQFAAMSARVGRDGMSDHHVEGTPNTPEGMFAFGSTMYGVNPDPGVKFAYHHLVTDDWWNELPGSAGYNTFEHVSTDPGGASEALWKETVDYQYFAFIEYNVPAVGDRGSGVFLHVQTKNATAGCVSIPKDDLIKVLTWLDPAKHPRIVISTNAELHNY